MDVRRAAPPLEAAMAALLAPLEAAPAFAARVEGWLAKGLAHALEHPTWPVVGLPRVLLAASEVAPERGHALVLGALAHFAGLDAIDDVQDDEASSSKWEGWTPAEILNLGGALLFLARRAWGLAGCDAGDEDLSGVLATYAGQWRDLQASPAAWLEAGEDEYLRTAQLKSGTSLQLIARAAAACTGRHAAREPLAAWALSLGTYLQALSDDRELRQGTRGPDLVLGKPNLAAIHAWQTAEEGERDEVRHTLEACRGGQLPVATWMRRLRAGGSLIYADLRLRGICQALADEAHRLEASHGLPGLAVLVPGAELVI